MAEATTDDDQPPRSSHAGELYRFQPVWWQKFPVYVLLVVGGLALVGGGVNLLTGGGRRPGSGVIGVVLIVVGIVIAGSLWRVAQSRVVITEQGLKIRNLVRSYHLSWDEIDGYERTNQHDLRLATGRRIHLKGMAYGPLGATARTEREAACLTTEIERHKQAQSSSSRDATPATLGLSGRAPRPPDVARDRWRAPLLQSVKPQPLARGRRSGIRPQRSRRARYAGGDMTFSRITVDPARMDGVPCIRGLRIPVAAVVGCSLMR